MPQMPLQRVQHLFMKPPATVSISYILYSGVTAASMTMWWTARRRAVPAARRGLGSRVLFPSRQPRLQELLAQLGGSVHSPSLAIEPFGVSLGFLRPRTYIASRISTLSGRLFAFEYVSDGSSYRRMFCLLSVDPR